MSVKDDQSTKSLEMAPKPRSTHLDILQQLQAAQHSNKPPIASLVPSSLANISQDLQAALAPILGSFSNTAEVTINPISGPKAPAPRPPAEGVVFLKTATQQPIPQNVPGVSNADLRNDNIHAVRLEPGTQREKLNALEKYSLHLDINSVTAFAKQAVSQAAATNRLASPFWLVPTPTLGAAKPENELSQEATYQSNLSDMKSFNR